MARRGWGEGSTYPRRDGRWVVTIRMRDGSRRMTYHSGPNAEDEARAHLDRLLGDRAAGVVGQDPTLGAYLRAWLTDITPTLAPATVKQHRNIVEHHLIPAMGSTRLSELSVPQVRSYLHRKRLHPQTVAHHRATLRRALNDAMRDGHVTRNVAALAKPPAVPSPERRWLTADQVTTLLAATRPAGDKPGSRWHALWALTATAGLRIAEALALTWDDIDTVARTVTVRRTLHRVPGRVLSDGSREPGEWGTRQPKTRGSRRTVPLTETALAALRVHELHQAQEQMRSGKRRRGLVFATPKGEPVHGTSALRDLKKDLKAARLPEVTVHQLRHSAASVMLEAGVPLKLVSDVLGHSTIRITADLYSHVSPGTAREAADRLEALLTAAASRTTVKSSVS